MDRKIVELLIQGKSIRQIKGELKVGLERLKKVRALAEICGYLNNSVQLPVFPEAIFPDRPDKRAEKTSDTDTLLQKALEWIIERLSSGWRPITVYEELEQQLKISVTRASFYRFLTRHKLLRLGKESRRVVPEIRHMPGESLQLDWGKMTDVIDPQTQKKRTLWAFIGVLGYSRYMLVRLVWSNDLATTIRALESMFQELGGVPKKLTSDNPKCFALTASKFEPTLNPGMELFVQHYGTFLECLPPRDPQKKGKVERAVAYARRLYEANNNAWQGLEAAELYIAKKCELANKRIHGSTRKKPEEEFYTTEKPMLRPLPALPYEKLDYGNAKVRQDGHVRFKNHYYSLDENFIGKEVVLMANREQVCIYYQGKCIEVHARLYSGYTLKNTKSHHLKPWERVMECGSYYRERAAKIGPDVERMIVCILSESRGFIDTRKIWGVLSLDKKHSYAEINLACRTALEQGLIGYRAVVSNILLEGLLEPQENSGKRVSADQQGRFTRPLSEYAKQIASAKPHQERDPEDGHEHTSTTT